MSNETPKILVVDDNEMNRDMLARRLQKQKYDVLMAEDGEQALEMVAQYYFDLVLLDIMMPKLSGYEVLERLKGNPATSKIPVIMISAVDELDSVVRCIEMGAEDYLFKPFNPVLLKARVGASVSKSQARLEIDKISIIVESMHADISALRDTSLEPDQQEHIHRIQEQLIELETLLKS